MTPSTQTAGQRMKDRGQQLALDFVGEAWQCRALELLREFAEAEPGRLFALEEFRAWSEAQGLPRPASHYAWGALPRLAVREGLMRWTGQYVTAKSPRTHAHPVKLWRAAC